MLKRFGFAGTVFPAILFVSISTGWTVEIPIDGTPSVATQCAVANFGDLARQPTIPVSDQDHGGSHPFMPVPYNLPVPAEALKTNEIHFQDSPPVTTSQVGALPSPLPDIEFPALGDDNTRIPPDVNGAVGVQHLMVTLNTQVRIQNRSGDEISTVSLQTFWSPVGPFGGPLSVFDPKVLYDPYNHRWMTTAVADADLGTSSVLIAVSQTSDPTGNWKYWRVDVDPSDAVGADYPSIGFNKHWICVQVNMFNIGTFNRLAIADELAGGTFNRSHIYCFDKTDLYAFGDGKHHLFDRSDLGGTQAPAITYDNSIPTLYLLQSWNGSYGCLRLYSITPTGLGGAPQLKLFSIGPCVGSTWAWRPIPASDIDFAPQMGTNVKIHTGDDRMLKVIYRNGSLWVAHTVFLQLYAVTHSSVQWWQLNTAGAILQRGRIDDPTNLTHYAYPSLAVNRNSDVLIGYSRFSSSQFASGNYSYRASTDPPNTLQSDVVLKAGEAIYNKKFDGPNNRWGDYSNTVVDPIGDMALWTIQEYAATPSDGSDRWGTWWGRIGYVSGDINNDGVFTPFDMVSELLCVYLANCTLPVDVYDMNCDGTLNLEDATILLNLVFLGTPPPC